MIATFFERGRLHNCEAVLRVATLFHNNCCGPVLFENFDFENSASSILDDLRGKEGSQLRIAPLHGFRMKGMFRSPAYRRFSEVPGPQVAYANLTDLGFGTQ